MKTKLLPLVAIISAAAAMPAAANNAYVTDSYGNIVRDSSDRCVRTIHWTADKQDASCKAADEKAAPAATETAATEAAAPAAEAKPAYKVPANIEGNGTNAYWVGSNGYVVKDGSGRCVRTINWTPEKQIDACEGVVKKPEPKPEPAPVVAKPKPEIKPFPAPVAKPVIAPAPINAPMHFTGFFDTNKTNLSDKAKTQLNDYADYMKAVDDVTLKITGHTDRTGSDAYNQKLSEKRAMAVKTYLEESGVAGDRMTAIGKGETSPIADNNTKAGRAENRRVEIEIVK
ncbi:OmpA family protein [Thiomicrorhabdus sp. 6S2-11]|uniref:OmpA family protein n=1 Tax=Thiomicrorhabdus marina TaxID=2818442 RepID=A0ABS3Q5G3_9GAMM|nr:OmpA family protein [Thiomicrorhabdus marina]MBO1927554.1 OmpA family protein [Thiomicrorhabdus marina]